jgi:hypothetical protein
VPGPKGFTAWLRSHLPTRNQVAQFLPAILIAFWLIATGKFSDESYFRIPLAFFAGGILEGLLILLFAFGTVAAAHMLGVHFPESEILLAKNPQVLGALLMVIGLLAYQDYSHRTDQRTITRCLEERATRLHLELENGRTIAELDSEPYFGHRLRLDPGGISWAIESCREAGY